MSATVETAPVETHAGEAPARIECIEGHRPGIGTIAAWRDPAGCRIIPGSDPGDRRRRPRPAHARRPLALPLHARPNGARRAAGRDPRRGAARRRGAPPARPGPTASRPRPSTPGDATTVIVRYRDGTSSARKTAARERAHATRERSRPDKGREVVRPAHGRSVAETVQALLADPAVAYAEPNYPIRLAASPMTEPLRSTYQWGLENAGGDCVAEFTESTCAVDVDIDAAAAWPVSTGAGVVVAVLDDGLDFTHPDLDTQAWTNPDDATVDGVDNDGNGFVDDVHGVNLCGAAGPSTELHGAGEDYHGTAVASVVAAATDDTGMAGVAPDARVMAVRWLINNKCMDTDMAAAAIEYAVDEGADVINASWGSEQPSTTLLNAVHLRRGCRRPDRRRRGQRGRDQLLPGEVRHLERPLGRGDRADRLSRLVLEPRVVGRHGGARRRDPRRVRLGLPVGLRDRGRDVVRGAARRGGRGPAARRQARAARHRRLVAQQAHQLGRPQPEARRGADDERTAAQRGATRST